MKSLVCHLRFVARLAMVVAVAILVASIGPRLAGQTTASDTRRSSQSSDKKPEDAGAIRPPYNDGDLLVCKFEHLKFPLDKYGDFDRKLIPKEIEALHGKKIRIRGWMIPTANLKVSSFVLMRDNQMSCRRDSQPVLTDFIRVTLRPGMSQEFTTCPIDVEGVFTIDVYKDEIDDAVLAAYHVDGESVRPIKPAAANSPK